MANITWNNLADFSGEQDSSGSEYSLDSTSLKQGYEHYNLNRGLIAYYPMDYGQSTHVHDATYNGNDGVANGATRVSGYTGSGAFSFNGVDNEINTNLPSSEIGSGPFTVSFWVKVGNLDPSQYPTFLSSWDGSGIICGMDDTVDNSRFRFRINGTPHKHTQPNLGQWYHFVGLRREDGSTEFIIDNATVATGSETGDISSNNFYLGQRPDGTNPFEGEIDELRIYNRALSKPEIQALYNLTNPTATIQTEDPRTGLVGEWKLDGDATDNAGSNNGTVNGATTATAYNGQGYAFDGSGDYIAITDNYDLDKSFAVSCWFNSTDTSTDGNVLVAKSKRTAGYIWWALRANTDGTIEFLVDDNNVIGITTATTSNTFLDGNWHHAVAVVDESVEEIQLYVDNVLRASTSISGYTTLSNPHDITFMRRHEDGLDYTSGILDEVRLYNRAISPTEIQRLYNLSQKKIPAGDNL